MLEIAGVSRIFADGSGLNPVDISVRTGEFISVLGPSGCGKSTLLRCVAGLETPQTGTISIDGREVFRAPGAPGAPAKSGAKSLNTPPARRGLSMVFQDLALWPHMSVADNVEFPLTVKAPGRPRVPAEERAERTAAALETVGLSAKADQRPAALSGGQQQRVAIARAIINRPGLILMDEPLSALDAALRDQMRHEITDLARTLGLTILYVTHDQQEAMSMADRVLVLNEGRIAQFAPPAEIYERPADAFVADFVGTMNRLDDLAVRPEQVTVTTETTAADAPLTGLTGTVLSCHYVGGRYELRCEVDGAPHPWLVYDGRDHDAGTDVQLLVSS
ncbi:MAG TPA: ABC transporter ATP-binding protein [Candidatus Corynebacterium avicola]|uniref:ABC-type quaternary amine transporter n=1 Tax=Candidatus Corynebacterium avicola TaxID=2838527 RepID=A0A9D1UKR6_9CORY|nr:ABC transporter ATP-binding protein [Candidatus Corynebacterium avicola]